jgi:hypothetical protein
MKKLKSILHSKKFNTIFYGVTCFIFCFAFVYTLINNEPLYRTIYYAAIAMYSGFLFYKRGLKK